MEGHLARGRAASIEQGWQIWPAVALAAVALGGLLLRMYAVGWGLPYVDHPDEPSAANTVLGMLRRGDWNPHFFKKPSLYYYALRSVFEAHWRYGLAKGWYSDLSQLPLGTYYYITTPGFFIWGRALTAALGAATILAVYAIGRRWWGTPVGLAAAALLAVLPFHVRNSQFMTVDVPTGLIAALALGAALRLLDDGRWRTYALAGLLVGLAASTKYPAGSVALAVVLAHGLRVRRASWRDLAPLVWAALWALAGFLIATPYALITPGEFVKGLLKQYDDYTVPGGDLFGRWPIGGYLSFFWSDGLLPLPSLAVLAGSAVVLRRRDRAGLVMLGFALPYLLFVLAQQKHFFRNLMPIYPVVVLLAGIGVVSAASAIAGRVRAWRGASGAPAELFGAGVAVVAALVVLHPLVNTIALDRLFAQTHSKVRAGEYVRANLPRGAPIAMALSPLAWPGEPMALLTEDVAENSAAWYRSQGYRYLVGNLRNDREHYAELRAQSTVLAAFDGELDGRPSPHMEVLDLGLHPEQLAIERRETTFGGPLRLLGFQRGAGKLRSTFTPLQGAAAVRPGQALRLNLYWQPLEKLDQNYAIFLHLLDAQGRTVAQRDTLIRGYDYPSSRWQPGELVVDLADLFVPPELPDGGYRLEFGVYDMQSMARLPIDGEPSGARILLDVQVRH